MFTGFLPVAQTSSFHTNFWGTFSFMTYACQAAAFISPILHDNALSLSLSLFSQKKGKGKSRIEKFKEGECRVGRWMQVGDGEKRGKVERRGGVRVDDGS